MTLRSLQREMVPWVKKNFPVQWPWQLLLGVVEEVGELAHAHLKWSQDIRTNENYQAQEEDAIGDIVIFLCNYCIERDLDMQEIVEKVWGEVKKRDWMKYPEKGVKNDTEV